MVSDDFQVRALADLGCGQDLEIAGVLILRRDRIDKSLEWPQRATIDPDKAVVVKRGLYREGRLIDDGQPSSTRRIEPFVEGGRRWPAPPPASLSPRVEQGNTAAWTCSARPRPDSRSPRR